MLKVTDFGQLFINSPNQNFSNNITQSQNDISFGKLNKTLAEAAKHCAYCGDEFSKTKTKNKGLTRDELKEIKDQKKKLKKTMEHIKPESQGGSNNISNQLPTCKACNNARGDMPLYEWFEARPEVEKNIKTILKELDDLNIDGVNYSEAVAKTISKELGRNFTFKGKKLNICA